VLGCWQPIPDTSCAVGDLVRPGTSHRPGAGPPYLVRSLLSKVVVVAIRTVSTSGWLGPVLPALRQK
jgi:hypothetical protein